MIFGCKWFHLAVALFVRVLPQPIWLDAIWRKKGVNADKTLTPFPLFVADLVTNTRPYLFNGPHLITLSRAFCAARCVWRLSLCIFGTRHALSQIMLLMAKNTIGIHFTFQKKDLIVWFTNQCTAQKKLNHWNHTFSIFVIFNCHSEILRDRTEYINSCTPFILANLIRMWL